MLCRVDHIWCGAGKTTQKREETQVFRVGCADKEWGGGGGLTKNSRRANSFQVFQKLACKAPVCVGRVDALGAEVVQLLEVGVPSIKSSQTAVR